MPLQWLADQETVEKCVSVWSTNVSIGSIPAMAIADKTWIWFSEESGCKLNDQADSGDRKIFKLSLCDICAASQHIRVCCYLVFARYLRSELAM
jgi:hypothetical protein